MKNEIIRGTGALHDMSAAGGVYEAEYVIHFYTKSTMNVGRDSTQHQIFTAQIRPLGDRTLKNGDYTLEQDGKTLFTLRKTGHLWDLIRSHIE